MKVPGSIYQDNCTYFALYNPWPDVYRKAPPSLIKKSDHVAHISYSFGKNSKGIDIFVYRSNENLNKEIDIKRVISRNGFNADELANIDSKYNIKAEIKREYLPVLDIVRKDIEDFARNPAYNPGKSRISLFNKIIPITEIIKINSKQYLRSGKQDFVPSCSLQANLDYSLGCISSLIPGMNASFHGDLLKDYFLDIHAECNYCYSLFKHQSFSKSILDIDKAQLKEELMHGNFIGADDLVKEGKIGVLRLGKNTEAGSKFTLDSLILTLETCLETKTRVILPTKFLKFNNEIAEFLKKTNSVLLYSITNMNELEKGAEAHGCNNEFRLEQARLYKEKGVNSNIYLHVDLPHKPNEREHKILAFSKRNDIPIQLLAWRIPSKEIAKKITGVSWDELINNNQNVFDFCNEENRGGYYSKEGTLIANKVHPFYEELVGKNQGSIRLCHHNKDTTYCGNCFLCNKGKIIPTEHIKINYKNKQRKGNWRRWKRRRVKEEAYQSLFPE